MNNYYTPISITHLAAFGEILVLRNNFSWKLYTPHPLEQQQHLTVLGETIFLEILTGRSPAPVFRPSDVGHNYGRFCNKIGRSKSLGSEKGSR